MLRVIARPQPSGTIFVDFYVSLQFGHDIGSLPLPYHWRTGDLSRSLLDLVVDADDYTVRKAILFLWGCLCSDFGAARVPRLPV